MTLQAILKIYVSFCGFYLKAADLKFLPFYPAGGVLWGQGCLVDPGLPFLWVAIVGWCEIGFGCLMPGMVFGRLVWSVGVMAVVVGIGGLWGPGRDCHEMNHIPERPLLAVFEVPNSTCLMIL